MLQIQNITNYALQTLTAAGVELVPFDSQGLNDVSADAWGDGTESYAFEDTDTLARYFVYSGCDCKVYTGLLSQLPTSTITAISGRHVDMTYVEGHPQQHSFSYTLQHTPISCV